MQLQIIKPGILSTVQDTGRLSYRGQAVPVSGSMDTLSARLVNMALGNDAGAAVIEFTYADAELKATTNLLLAWAGDGALLTADGNAIPTERPVFIPEGTIIKLNSNPTGCRTYLAVAGGWNVPEVMGSRSTYVTAGFGGFDGRALQAGDVLNASAKLSALAQKIYDKLKSDRISYPRWQLGRTAMLSADRKAIRVVPGPEFSWFDGLSVINFLSQPFAVTPQSNRMGYQLQGPPMQRRVEGELLSTAVTPGTIQVTNNNDLILLMADCQTTGGYPRIGQVAAVDLPLCGQLKPGDKIRFEEISRREAEALLLQREDDLAKLASAIQSAF